MVILINFQSFSERSKKEKNTDVKHSFFSEPTCFYPIHLSCLMLLVFVVVVATNLFHFKSKILFGPVQILHLQLSFPICYGKRKRLERKSVLRWQILPA